jgi:hypothetical protein
MLICLSDQGQEGLDVSAEELNEEGNKSQTSPRTITQPPVSSSDSNSDSDGDINSKLWVGLDGKDVSGAIRYNTASPRDSVLSELYDAGAFIIIIIIIIIIITVLSQ